ncbi:ATP-dependent RNA helicase RhlE [Fundidesulfovibrio magnetotacticus]|uniref:DEAD-box ATP-dependent RNA helicase RhpA n=1 Tax=Fundidesulfovibrio magnetotacticus TaxID=2730080 RepID=A0A6V8LT07_9BACT|nr:DEAD/DEAH box helicase [Fundidesulfovibrio magnetotacticus]GFK93209.1 ATP-dependent RNA helicase RhlE [Fundidesulfovibrio magnetotacticus]
MQFDDFDLHASILANVAKLGYETPTPIQREAIPHVKQRRDVMGLAQTGTGKTAAFLLPIIDRFLREPKPLRGSARCLVVAPTRELAEQIAQSAKDYTAGMRMRTATVYGGVSLSPQAANLRRGADILVACPGRLLDHLNQGNANLSSVEVLVLDEADHMFDMGFLPDIRKILAKLPAERQTLLFSATMPESIRGLAGETLKDPALVKIGHAKPAQTIEQRLYPVPQHLKTKLLLNLLGKADDGSVLVFARTKHRAKRLAEQLCRQGHQAACIQGNLSQNQRQKAMDGFRDGRYSVLVATDIAARGIDVSRVAHVINYDLPDTPETYTHRVGRTGRAEREGQAHSLITHEDTSMVRAIERLLGKAIERRKVEGFDYGAVAPDRDTEFQRPPLPGRGQARAPRPQASQPARQGGMAAKPGVRQGGEPARQGQSGVRQGGEPARAPRQGGMAAQPGTRQAAEPRAQAAAPKARPRPQAPVQAQGIDEDSIGNRMPVRQGQGGKPRQGGVEGNITRQGGVMAAASADDAQEKNYNTEAASHSLVSGWLGQDNFVMVQPPQPRIHGDYDGNHAGNRNAGRGVRRAGSQSGDQGNAHGGGGFYGRATEVAGNANRYQDKRRKEASGNGPRAGQGNRRGTRRGGGQSA